MKPFLKWAGGKFRSVDRIKQHLPDGKRLIEPFAGSAALFLNTDYPSYLIAEINRDLIDLYKVLKTEGESFVAYCKEFFDPKYNTKEMYYQLREEFNHTHEVRRKAALFVYLNRRGFNGLCRYNSKGKFNVPFGKQKTPLPEKEMLAFLAKTKHAKFIEADFVKTMQSAQIGDVVYCDPPYVPLTDTAYFTCYSGELFTLEHQQLLADTARDLAKRGITVVLSNHDTPFVREIYAGAEIHSFPVSRFISRDGSSRKPAMEVLAIY